MLSQALRAVRAQSECVSPDSSKNELLADRDSLMQYSQVRARVGICFMLSINGLVALQGLEQQLQQIVTDVSAIEELVLTPSDHNAVDSSDKARISLSDLAASDVYAASEEVSWQVPSITGPCVLTHQIRVTTAHIAPFPHS